MKVQMEEEFVNIDGYCDRLDQQLKSVHPLAFTKEENEIIKKELKKHESLGDSYHWLIGAGNVRMYGQGSNDILPKYNSFGMHILQNYEGYKHYCRQNYPKVNEQVCAGVHSTLKPVGDLDKIPNSDFGFYREYKAREDHESNLKIKQNIEKAVLYFGLLLYLLQVRLDQKKLICLVVAGNTILMAASLTKPFTKFGWDAKAYL